MPETNDATIGFVPRETVSQTLGCLDRLIALTPRPYDLVAVVAGYPSGLVEAVRQRLEPVGGRLIEFAHYVTPNEARNAVLAKARTDYIAFIDHDVHVAENWLAPLVACARETGAAIVSPVIFEREPLFTWLHMVGGEARVDPLPSGRNAYHERHVHAHKPLAEIAEPITRHETGLAEFHTVLVETGWLRSVGGLDPGLLSVFEHWDMSVAATSSGRTIYVEPESKVTYVPVTRVTSEDARWFALRWSEAWAEKSILRVAGKYDIPPQDSSFDGLHGFLRTHRGYRYIPVEKKIGSLVGRRAARWLTKHVAVPVMEMSQRPQMERDLALWREQRNEFVSRQDFVDQS